MKSNPNTEDIISNIDASNLEKIKELIAQGNSAILNNHPEVILVIGKTGAGKSTLVNYLTNMDKMRVVLHKDPNDEYDE